MTEPVINKHKRSPYLTVEEVLERKKERKSHFDEHAGYDEDFIKEIFLKYEHLVAGRSVLDCGTGNGWFTKYLENREYKNLYGFDIFDGRRDDSKIGEFSSVDANLEKFPWPDNSFDCLTAWCLVAHLENPHHFIREAHRVLKPGGTFFNYMPHINSLHAKKNYFKSGDLLRYAEGINHISIFTPALYKTTVLKYFDEIEQEYGVDARIYKNRLGWLKKIGVARNWSHFKQWFGTSTIWVLKNK